MVELNETAGIPQRSSRSAELSEHRPTIINAAAAVKCFLNYWPDSLYFVDI